MARATLDSSPLQTGSPAGVHSSLFPGGGGVSSSLSSTPVAPTNSVPRPASPSASLSAVASRELETRLSPRMFIIVLAFVGNWSLYLVGPVLYSLISANDVPPVVDFVAMFFAHLDSLLNPILYGILDKRFRDSFRKLFVCCPESYRLKGFGPQDADVPTKVSSFASSEVQKR